MLKNNPRLDASPMYWESISRQRTADDVGTFETYVSQLMKHPEITVN